MEDPKSLVITGMSGKFPKCDNVEQLKESLLGGIDLVTDYHGRWPKDLHGLTNAAGILNSLEDFDASYFKYTTRQANGLDPRTRILMEVVFEAIVDAGYNPGELAGTRTGVFLAILMENRTEFILEFRPYYTRLVRSSGVMANFISFAFDFKGPSYGMDTACSSSLVAFSQAAEAMRSGQCDTAIVCSAQVVLSPYESLEYNVLKILSPSGRCKTFDVDRDGFVKSEAAVALVLQRREHARRIYANVLGNGANNDGFKKRGIAFPEREQQKKLIGEVYDRFNIDPNDVKYLEAHGTGTKTGDTEEMQSVHEYFMNRKKDPLLVGSVKSCLGHTEIASGLVQIVKMIISMEGGVIPGMLHLKQIADDIHGVKEGHIKIVSKNTPWPGGCAAINSFGIGGANAHIVLSPNDKMKLPFIKKQIPRLIKFFGRTQKSLTNIIDFITAHPNDPELFALFDKAFQNPIDRFQYRGYYLLGDVPKHETYKLESERREIWFVYSGVGSQWPQMGKDLMKFDIFRRSMEACAKILEPYGVDLLKIIMSEDNGIYYNFINLFTSITAMMVCLTDLLKALDIKADGVIGHSLGELGCAYADGGFTKEEVLSVAYARGYAISHSNVIPGTMAVVGLQAEDLKKILPSDIYIACYNCVDNLTISGPLESIRSFVQDLKSKGIFAEVLEGAQAPFHTKYIKDAGALFMDLLKKIIVVPKPRTKKWLSSSLNNEQKDLEWGRYNSVEYHHNNFVNTVWFYQSIKNLPSDAIVIEVSAKGLLQTILRKNLSRGVSVLHISNDQVPDNVDFVLNSIGRFHLYGVNPNLSNLYESDKLLPVGRNTPTISHLLDWDHSVKYAVQKFSPRNAFGEGVVVDLNIPEMKFMEGHIIEGKCICAAAGYLVFAWEAFTRLLGKAVGQVPVVVESFKIKRMTLLPSEDSVVLKVNILEASGDFEVTENGATLATGVLKVANHPVNHFKEDSLKDENPDPQLLPLTSDDVYARLARIGLQYDKEFKGVAEMTSNHLEGKIKWFDNWTSYLDAMIHFSIFADYDLKRLTLPLSIERVLLHPTQHLEMAKENNGILKITSNLTGTDLKSGGIEINGLEAVQVPPRRSLAKPFLEQCSFVPYDILEQEFPLGVILTVSIQLAIENSSFKRSLKILGLCQDEPSMGDELQNTLKYIASTDTLYNLSVIQVNMNSEGFGTRAEDYSHGLIVTKADVDIKLLCKYLSPSHGNFALLRCSPALEESLPKHDFTIVSKCKGPDGTYLLIRRAEKTNTNAKIINITTKNFDWLDELQKLGSSFDKTIDTIYLVCDGEPTCGLVGLFNCLRMELTQYKLKGVLVMDKNCEKFALNSKFYEKQLQKGLAMNVLKNGKWGSHRFTEYQEIKEREVQDAYLYYFNVGDFSSLHMIETSFPPESSVSVYCAGLNFKEVLIVNGVLSGTGKKSEMFKLGLDFSGKNQKGERIFGLGEQTFATKTKPHPILTWKIPDNWTMEEAVTIPVVYCTLIYGLFLSGNLRKGESILIHSGSGGIGLAAIHIALQYGCEIFTTAGSKEKRDFIKKEYPQIKEENIGNSRDSSFEEMIRRRTKGRGVDIVINSLAGDLMEASMRCLATSGRFIEIGKTEFANNAKIKSSMFRRNTSMHVVSLDHIMHDVTVEEMKELHALMLDGIRTGLVKPIAHRKIFNTTQIQEAFKLMNLPTHIGKIVIKLREDDGKSPKPVSISAVPRICFDSRKSYILLGGLGGFGLELAKWMEERGAKKFILNGRSGVANGYQSATVRDLRRWGAEVIISKHDSSELSQAKALLQEASKIGPVGGIFNLALVLKDALLENQTKQNFRDVYTPKVKITQNMDQLTRQMCPELDHFVAFSSISCGKGNMGQSNYGFANSCVERICERRNDEGLPGFVIQWGPIADVGSFARAKLNAVGSAAAQPIDSCLEVLDKFFAKPSGIASSILLRDDSKDVSEKTTLFESLLSLFGIKDASTIDDETSLSELGMDSLMVFEVKQFIYREHQVDLTIKELKELTVGGIKDIDKKQK